MKNIHSACEQAILNVIAKIRRPPSRVETAPKGVPVEKLVAMLDRSVCKDGEYQRIMRILIADNTITMVAERLIYGLGDKNLTKLNKPKRQPNIPLSTTNIPAEYDFKHEALDTTFSGSAMPEVATQWEAVERKDITLTDFWRWRDKTKLIHYQKIRFYITADGLPKRVLNQFEHPQKVDLSDTSKMNRIAPCA